MNLIRKIPRAPKRSTRWRSQAHCNHVRSHACVACGCDQPGMIEVAHVRLGSGAGIGQKPDDWRTVALCRGCHRHQHILGEASFWVEIERDPEALIEAFIKASPKRAEIMVERVRRG